MRFNHVKSIISLIVATQILGLGCAKERSLPQKVSKIHERSLTIDSHIDWPIRQ